MFDKNSLINLLESNSVVTKLLNINRCLQSKVLKIFEVQLMARIQESFLKDKKNNFLVSFIEDIVI